MWPSARLRERFGRRVQLPHIYRGLITATRARARQSPLMAKPSICAPDALAVPIAEGFRRLGIERTSGYQLIKAGRLETYTVGRWRYVMIAELQRFIRERIEATKTEDPMAKVSDAVAASLAARRG